MSSNGKRLLASFFGIHLNEDLPQLQSLVPERVANEIVSGALPRFKPATIMLAQNETCHFMDRAALAVQKTEKSYWKRRSGSSYKITKNWTIHSGSGLIKPVEQSWYEFKEGVIFVTNERIIFVAPKKRKEKKLKKLTAIIPYTDAIAFQFGSETITVVVPQSELIALVIKMLS